MKEQEVYKLRFPIGEFVKPNQISDVQIKGWIVIIAAFPEKIKYATKGMRKAQLQWKYRPGGWTIEQVINHCADSHMNSMMRFKLALTEKEPTIRPYFEDRWAELSDSLTGDVTDAILLLTGLHNKWRILLEELTEEQLVREFIHPEHGQRISLAENIGFYAWHCTHHLTHIRLAIDFQGRF